MTRPRPVIGVTSSDQQARWGNWNTAATLVPTAYVRALETCGSIPVVLASPAAASSQSGEADKAANAVVERLDAVVMSGGADLDPTLYGEEPHDESQSPEPARDAYELALVRACARRGLPVLAICRGMQLLNVSRGGTLVQHLPDRLGAPDHMPEPGSFALRSVHVEPDSKLARVLGRTEAVVPCHHHQAVDRLGGGLIVSAMSEDGVVEALEDPVADFLVAVQWHPEVGQDRSLFEALVAACGPGR